jgi:thiamine biosynthesis lipoprotein
MRSIGWLVTLMWISVAMMPGPALNAQEPARLTLYTSSHHAMGTEYSLELYSENPSEAASVSDEVFDEIDRLDHLLSNYLDTSELSRINRNAGTEFVTTDPEMMEFLQQSEHWSKVSQGAFDITVGRLMKAYGFFRHQGRVPTERELQQLRDVTGWQKVQLDARARTVHFNVQGIELDPGGIGKGFAVDAAVRILRADHIRAALLSAGSSTIYALGAPPHSKGWRVVVPGPLPLQSALSVVTLRDTSLSSADCSQKNFTLGGHFYCHIMDPRTMRPVEGRIQVTIIDPSATASDALSNVIFVESPEQSIATLHRYAPESHALIVSGVPDAARCTSFHWQSSITSARCAREPKQGSLESQ